MWRTALGNYCSFHTSTCRDAKIANVMRKVMGQTSKKRKVYSEAPILPSADSFSKGSHEGKYSGSARRVSVLNKLFMKHITDLLATGEYASEFAGHKIEINRVQIAPDYKGLNVFWVARGTEDDEVVERLLKKNAGFLRHELSSLRVMGMVPMIQFVKDKHYAKLVELEARLAKADFGEDHIPTEMATRLKSQLELFTTLPSNVKEKLQELDETLDDIEEEEEELPPMPHDVLGLNHYEILNRIKKNMKKSEARHRFDDSEPSLNHTVNDNPIEYSSNKERREAFKNFLMKRELMRSKERKREKNYLPDIEYIKEEFEERQKHHFDDLEGFDQDEPDYLNDDDNDGIKK